MRIFLTGGTGFIGSNFLKIALDQGHEVRALKWSTSSTPRIDLYKHPEWLQKTMPEVSPSDLSNIDVLVHLAAHSANVPYDTLENCIEKNVIEPLRLFHVAIQAGIGNFVVAGSCFEYGKAGERYDFIPVDAPLEPIHTYPVSKALSSITFRQFAIEQKINLSYHRIFQVFGEGEPQSRLWPSLRKAALTGENFPMTKGEQVRDFIEVTEVARKLLAAVESIGSIKSTLSPQYFNLGSGKPKSILEFSRSWWEKWSAEGELLVGALPYREGEVMRYVPKI